MKVSIGLDPHRFTISKHGLYNFMEVEDLFLTVWLPNVTLRGKEKEHKDYILLIVYASTLLNRINLVVIFRAA